jgi:hypothetical protein
MVGRTSILPKEGFFLFYKTKNKAVPQPFSWLLGQPLLLFAPFQVHHHHQASNWTQEVRKSACFKDSGPT